MTSALLLKTDIGNHPPLVISSSKSTSNYWHCLGLYRWDEGKNCYKQVSTDLGNGEGQKDLYSTCCDIFLYQAKKNGFWYVSDKHGETEGFLKNTSRSSYLPLRQWMYYDSKRKKYQESFGIQIKV